MNKKILIAGLLVSVMLLVPINSAYSNIDIQIDDKTAITSHRGDTLYVGGSGPYNYTKIQDAIDDASDGDTVFVYNDSSPYYESIQINESINLIGEDRNTTAIIDNSSEHSIYIKTDNVSIREFTIQNSNKWGIRIEYYFGNCTISENIILNNNWSGISMHFSNNNIIKDNTFFDNNAMLLACCNNNTISDNTINHSIFAPNYGYGICLLSNSRWNNISGNIIKDNDEGIKLFYSEYNFIFNNIITSNEGYGIEIRDSSDNSIFGNNISYNCDPGIYIKESANNNIIYKNNFVYNAGNAVDEGNNIWDDGDYGNYWNDYEEKYPLAIPKLLKPWMWNTPYEIDGGNSKDNCPLIKPWPKSKSKSVTSDIEEDCFECQSDDRPICNLLNKTIQRLWNLDYYYYCLISTISEDSILYDIILFSAYLNIGIIARLERIGIILKCGLPLSL